jgi:ribose 1,5-bisphosphokinase PhnN
MEGLIVTFCFDSSTDMPVVEEWASIVSQYGGNILPIYLNVSPKVLSQRVQETSRIGTKKIQCRNELKTVLSENDFGAIPNSNTISVATSHLCVENSVRRILDHLL